MRRSECGTCGLGPCACAYIARLELPGSTVHFLLDVAVEQMGMPRPHRDACPCPGCYSVRLGSWKVDA